MSNEAATVEYQTFVIGAGLLVKGVLDQLGVVSAIDQELQHQPDIATTYGQLAQAIIINGMSAGAEFSGHSSLDRYGKSGLARHLPAVGQRRIDLDACVVCGTSRSEQNPPSSARSIGFVK